MSEPQDMITDIKVPIYLKYNFTAGTAPARFLTQLKKGVLTGQRCPICANVYAPPRGSCAACGVPTEEEVPPEGSPLHREKLLHPFPA